MADTGRDARILTKLREYVNTIETNDYDLDAPRNGQAYEKDLSKTLQELKKQYSQEIAKLENVSSHSLGICKQLMLNSYVLPQDLQSGTRLLPIRAHAFARFN